MMLNSHIAAHALISAWENWTDQAEETSDAILNAALGYADTLLKRAPHQIPEAVRPHFAACVLVMTADPTDPSVDRPDLTFDEALEPLRRFLAEG